MPGAPAEDRAPIRQNGVMKICERRFKLEVPNDPASMPVIRDFVGNVAKGMGFGEEERASIELAAEEAASNVILHAFAPGEEASFSVICETTALGLKIILQEMGRPFDPSLVPECAPAGPDPASSEGVRGICLMRGKMDEVSFHNLGRGGKETHLFKYLDQRSVGSCRTAEELDETQKARIEAKLPKGSVSYLVRRMKPEEAVEVAKCAYEAYGYSYLYEHIYYPERIRRFNDTGKLVSYVAVTAEGEIIGHAAIRNGAGRDVGEIGVAFVKPKFRGQGCLKDLTEALIQEGKRRGFTGLRLSAVTSHPYSQKAALKCGFGACCLRLARLDAEEFLEIPTGKRKRESLLTAFRYLHPPPAFRIFAPLHHGEMILRIYEGLGAHPQWAREEMGLPQGPSSVRVTADPYHTAKIEIDRYGEDVVDGVKRHLKALCLDRIEAVYLYLHLGDPLTAGMTAEFEKMGFFFAGINPDSPGTDLLVLQFLNNLAVDTSRLQIASEMGRQIAAYIIRLHSEN